MINAECKWKRDPVESIGAFTHAILSRAMRVAMNAGAAPVKAATQAAAPVELGHLQKSFRIKVKSYRAAHLWVAMIGASKSVKKKKGKGKNKKEVKPARYQALVNYGTKHFQGKHFLEAGLSRSRDQFVAEFTRKLREILPGLVTI